VDLITVGNYADLASAEVAASILESAGIECVIPDENLAGVAWQMVSALQGVRLQVADENRELARVALEQPEPAPAEEATRLPLREDVCIMCGSESMGPPKWKNRLKAISILFPPVLLLWPLLAAVNSRTQCVSCGHAWR
jgi:hypothetical protein